MYRRYTGLPDPCGMNGTAKTVLHTLSGGALSAPFTLAGTNRAEAAPPPAPGTEEEVALRQERAARVAKRPSPSPVNEERRAEESRDRVDRANPKTPPKRPLAGLRAAEVEHGVPPRGWQARPGEASQAVRWAAVERRVTGC